MLALLRLVTFFFIVRPLTSIVLGLNVRHREHLPIAGPAIIVANHNSHLDTAVILSLFPYRVSRRIRPVAAADYFFRNPALAWFTREIVRIIPVDRTSRSGFGAMLEMIAAALDAGDIVLLFPEGTRGEPERLSEFRSGIAHVVKRHPSVPVIPLFVHGAGKALPRGEGILVPFFCDVFVGEALHWTGDRSDFMANLEARFEELAAEGGFPPWQ